MHNAKIEKGKFVFEILENAGFECYAVGGCVRDILLNLEPHDIDFTTNALPDKILALFKDYKTIELGKKYGTISVIKDDDIYEITTYRIDGVYTDSRHPDKVNFSSNLKDDLARRDFTINAMAMDKTGKILDFYGGREDLKNRVVRTVGNPQARFSEDALRIFRALRFSARLGFTVEKVTADACHSLCHLLSLVHPQRMRDELSELILSDNAPKILSEYRDVIASIIPEISPCFDFQQITAHHRYDVYTHTIKAISFSPKDLIVRLALLFHDIAKPICAVTDKAGLSHFKGHPEKSADIAAEILKSFSYPSDFINSIRTIIQLHDTRFSNSRNQIKRTLASVSEEDFKRLIAVQRCDILAQSEYLRECKLESIYKAEMEAERILEKKLCFKLSDMKVNGNDILSLGINGKNIGVVLEHLLSLIIDDKIPNKRDELIMEAKHYISSIDK